MPAPASDTPIDLVDACNEVVGTIQRDEALQEGMGFRVVHALLTDANGNLLLQRLAPEHERSPGQLGSSVAGYLFSGESFVDAIRRRSHEELGVDLQLELLGVVQMRDNGARKFIALFGGELTEVPTLLPRHVDALVPMSMGEAERALEVNPSRFTSTFPHVLDLYRVVVKP